MFLTEIDYMVVIGENALKAISQIDEENRVHAELVAQEEVCGYLRPKYDCNAIFSAEGDARNRLIIMHTCDIALYHMSASMPQKMGSDIRKERYDRAVKWLESVQAGRIVPDLPLATDEEGHAVNGTFAYGCQQKQHNNW